MIQNLTVLFDRLWLISFHTSPDQKKGERRAWKKKKKGADQFNLMWLQLVKVHLKSYFHQG